MIVAQSRDGILTTDRAEVSSSWCTAFVMNADWLMVDQWVRAVFIASMDL